MPPGIVATSAWIAQRATMTPSTPPIIESARLSVRSWRISRRRPAPSAARSDISRLRETARASWRLATFAHAMSSTTPTNPSRISSDARTGPTVTSRSSRVSGASWALVSGYCAAMSRSMRSRSACADASVTPDLSRPKAQTAGFARVNQLLLGADVMGSQASMSPKGSL